MLHRSKKYFFLISSILIANFAIALDTDAVTIEAELPVEIHQEAAHDVVSPVVVEEVVAVEPEAVKADDESKEIAEELSSK